MGEVLMKLNKILSSCFTNEGDNGTILGSIVITKATKSVTSGYLDTENVTKWNSIVI